MTPAEKADFRKLTTDKAFLAFAYRTMVRAGLFSAGGDRLEYLEGRRSLALEILNDIEAMQPEHTDDGIPVAGSIQILLSVAQTAPKEKNLGRRRDPYSELGDGTSE